MDRAEIDSLEYILLFALHSEFTSFASDYCGPVSKSSQAEFAAEPESIFEERLLGLRSFSGSTSGTGTRWNPDGILTES